MSSLSGSAQTAALCSCQNLLFATVGVRLLSYWEKQTHRFPNCRCILYNKHNPPQSSRPSNDQSIREFLKADLHWFGTNVNIYVNVLLVCWARCRSCDSKDFLSDREYIQNPPDPPPALTRAPADTRWVIVWCRWELAFIRENIGAAQPLCWLFHQGP